MKFNKEVEYFKKTNGNSDYTERDMLMFLCSKTEKQALDISEMKIILGTGEETFKWLRATDAAFFTFFCGILYLILSFHQII